MSKTRKGKKPGASRKGKHRAISISERNIVSLIDLDGKLWKFPSLREMVRHLENYKRNPKYDANVGARIPRSMKAELVDLKSMTGVRYADVVRMGIAEALRRAK